MYCLLYNNECMEILFYTTVGIIPVCTEIYTTMRIRMKFYSYYRERAGIEVSVTYNTKDCRIRFKIYVNTVLKIFLTPYAYNLYVSRC